MIEILDIVQEFEKLKKIVKKNVIEQFEGLEKLKKMKLNGMGKMGGPIGV